MRRKYICKAKRIVVKLGTSILSDSRGALSKARINEITKQVSQLIAKGKKISIVSSGAIGCGMSLMKLKRRPKSLPMLQATAACGQGQLMKFYAEALGQYKLLSAQMLLTQQDLQDHERYLNARNTLNSLIKSGLVPIVNENDTVATNEIRFGDNDYLASLVAHLFNADLLVLLSDVDGLHDKKGKVITQVDKLSGLEKLVWEKSSQITVGGMRSKLKAARIANKFGIAMVIANGRRKDILNKLINGDETGTLFLPKLSRLVGGKHWNMFKKEIKC